MKKIHTMTIVSLMLVAVLAVTGCKKEHGKVTLGARIESGRNAKVYIDGVSPCWHNGDLLRINNQTCTTSAALGSSAQITNVDANDNGYRAVYPLDLLVDPNADITGNESIAIELPRVQTYEFDGLDQVVKVPIGACSSTTSLSFRNLCSLIKVVISSQMDAPFRLDSIGVDATAAWLSGEGEARVEGGEGDVVTLNGRAHHSVSLAFPVLAPEISRGLRNTYVYYIVAPKFDRNDVTIRLYADNGRYATFQKRDVELRANSIATVSLTVEELEQGAVDPLSIGVLPGLFTVASGRQVHFSKGNLQFTTTGQHAVAGGVADGTWRFAEHQYDYVGSSNSQAGENYTGWIDLFGRATSGWNSGFVCYRPYSTSNSYDEYFSDNMTSNTDWGVYNAIENGGNAPGMWRTLTKAEWVYLFTQRTDAAAKYGAATVAGVNGVVVLPDDWTIPAGLEFNNGFGTGYSLNTYSAEAWLQMETAGAVFLPAAGHRRITDMYGVNGAGYYWSATKDGTTLSFLLHFTQTSLNPQGGESPAEGCSVRLVKVD